MTDTTLTPATPTVASQLLGWDHLEWWVGNARAVTAWLTSGFGFEVVAYAGPETGVADRVSYVLAQGAVRFVVTAGLGPDSEVSQHVLRHGDGIRHLAWRVDDAEAATISAAAKGATVVAEPTSVNGDAGSVTTAAIATYGETRHLFVERSGSSDGWGPGFATDRLPPRPSGAPVGATSIDHVVGNVEQGRLDEWVAWYVEVLGFREMRHFDAEQISTRYSALRSTVVHNGLGVVLPINEPAPGLQEESQIEEFLDAYKVRRACSTSALATPEHRRPQSAATMCAPQRPGSLAGCRRPTTDRDAKERVAGFNRSCPGTTSQHLDIRKWTCRYRRLSAADLPRDGDRPADSHRRDHPTGGRHRVRRGKFQGVVRGDRT